MVRRVDPAPLTLPVRLRALVHTRLADIPTAQRRKLIRLGAGALLLWCLLCVLAYHAFAITLRQYDLRIYHDAMESWASGRDIYDYWQWDRINGRLGFTYPPFAALLMVPMASMNLGVVVVLNFLLTLGCLGVFAAAILQSRWQLRTPQLLAATVLIGATATLFQPIAQTIGLGQINLLLAALIAVDLLVLDARNSRWTGILIGLAAAIKIVPGAFLVYFLVARKWRPLILGLVTVAASCALMLVIAPRSTWRYFSQLLWESDRVGVASNTSNVSLSGMFSRFADGGHVPGWVWLTAVAALLVVVVYRIRGAVAGGDRLSAMVIIGFFSVLACPVSWIHHAVWVLPAGVVLVTAIAAGRRHRTAEWFRLVGLSATGAALWFFDVRALFDLPATDYSGAGIGQLLIAALPTLWLLLATVLLPVSSDKRIGQSAPAAVVTGSGVPTVR